MVRKLLLGTALLTALVIGNGAQAQISPPQRQPQGKLFERFDGSYGYVVGHDWMGQWQVAHERPQLWLGLVAANPQVANPDDIFPGDTLNVPVSLALLFPTAELENARNEKARGDALFHPAPTAPVTSTNRALWGIGLAMVLGGLLVYFIVMAVHSGRERQRIRRDPYSGPPIREGGLPTAEAAVDHFRDQYQRERGNLRVRQNVHYPATVSIQRIRAVDVRGPMLVDYANGAQERDLDRWTPAWECTLSDGSQRYSLTQCANDVRRGEGLVGLPATQVRARQDVPDVTPDRQVWPVVIETPEPAPAQQATPDVATDLPVFSSVRVTGPGRYVMHTPDNRDHIVDLGVIKGIKLGILAGIIFVEYKDGTRENIGRIVPESEPRTMAVAEGEGASSANAATAAAAGSTTT